MAVTFRFVSSGLNRLILSIPQGHEDFSARLRLGDNRVSSLLGTTLPLRGTRLPLRERGQSQFEAAGRNSAAARDNSSAAGRREQRWENPARGENPTLGGAFLLPLRNNLSSSRYSWLRPAVSRTSCGVVIRRGRIPRWRK